MKKLKRVLALLLAVAMIAGLAACGNNSGNTTPTPDAGKATDAPADPTKAPVEKDPEPTAEPEKNWEGIPAQKDANGNIIDLGGIHVTLGDFWSAPVAEDQMTAADEALADWMAWCAETYNFTWERKKMCEWGEDGDLFAQWATAGTDGLNIIMCMTPGKSIAPLKQGLSFDLSTLDCLDFSEAKWNKSAVDECTLRGGIYGCNYGLMEPRNGVWFNKRLLQEAGIEPDSLYDLQENMEWNWAKFEELCAKTTRDTNSDGVYDTYALGDSNTALYNAAIASNGTCLFGKDANGKFVNNTLTEDYLTAINWAIELEKKYKMSAPVTFDADGNEVAANWDWFYASFINGEFAFQTDNEYRCTNMKDAGMADDFGFVCFPMGPKMNDYTNLVTDNKWLIPASIDKDTAWKIAFVFDLYSQPLPGYEDPMDNILASRANKYCDSKALDLTYRRMAYNGRVNYQDWIEGLNLGPDYWWGFGGGTPQSQAEAMKDSWDALVAEANK